MAKILIICTANICRSPVVEALLRDRLHRRGLQAWGVASAGTWAMDPRPASRYSQELLLEWEGLDISDHQARMVNQKMIDNCDLILTMEMGHAEALRIEFPAAAGKIFLLSEMADGRRYNISDPYGTTKPNYENMVREVRELIEKGLPQIIRLAGGSTP